MEESRNEHIPLEKTDRIEIDLILVARFGFRDEDGFLIHREQREQPIFGTTEEERTEVFKKTIREVKDIQNKFYAKCEEMKSNV